ncbi:MAG: hypothetical protein ABGZ35_29985 [Planctomycetaceae bacterium]
MGKHRSFKPSDFSLRDLSGFLVAYVIISAISVLAGLALPAIPPFWGGLLCGVGIGFLGALLLLYQKKEIDIINLPEPSTNVKTMCADPNCRFPSRAFIEAVKTYCDESGASLTEGTELLKDYVARQSSQQ